MLFMAGISTELPEAFYHILKANDQILLTIL